MPYQALWILFKAESQRLINRGACVASQIRRYSGLSAAPATLRTASRRKPESPRKMIPVLGNRVRMPVLRRARGRFAQRGLRDANLGYAPVPPWPLRVREAIPEPGYKLGPPPPYLESVLWHIQAEPTTWQPEDCSRGPSKKLYRPD